MRKPEIKRRIRAASHAAERDIRDHARRGGMFARGMAGEGYAGGYRDALYDVLLLLESDVVSDRRDYWEEPSEDRHDG